MISFQLQESDIHVHLRTRMRQRGISQAEIQETFNQGWPAKDTKEGTWGKTMVFEYRQEWEGQWFEEKEVTVYYKHVQEHLVLLTVKARYGKDFPREDS